jgi:hypothetical protein
MHGEFVPDCFTADRKNTTLNRSAASMLNMAMVYELRWEEYVENNTVAYTHTPHATPIRGGLIKLQCRQAVERWLQQQMQAEMKVPLLVLR